MLNYIPQDWYWLAEDGRIFSSLHESIVDPKDAGWVEARESGRWTQWPVDEDGEQTDAALQDVLSPYGIHLNIADLKTALMAMVDADAEAQRLKYITGGAGQALTYAQKAEEANSYISASDPSDADYPLLLAEVGVTAETIDEVASVVRRAHQQWQQIGALIEAVRLSSKQAIGRAESAGDARSTYAAIIWPG